MTEQIHGLDITLTCDGGIIGGNPGGSCYGSWVSEVNGQTVAMSDRVEFPQHATNNEAEYEALLSGLRSICGCFSDKVLKHSRLTVRTDSQLMRFQVLGLWRCKAENLRPMLSHARTLLRRFGDWKVLWIPREEMVKEVGH